jgi:hypothetical protein
MATSTSRLLTALVRLWQPRPGAGYLPGGVCTNGSFV